MILYRIYSFDRDAYLTAEIKTPSGARVCYFDKDPERAKVYKSWSAANKAAVRTGCVVLNAKEAQGYASKDQ